MSRARTWLAVLVALPISIVAIGSMAFTFSELLNPCVVWGASNSGSVYRSADRPCKEGKGVGETRMRAGFEMAVVPGVILLAAVLGSGGRFARANGSWFSQGV
jgi:hypothetical protein